MGSLLGTLDLLRQPPPSPLFLLHWIDDPHAEYSPPADYLASLAEQAAALPRPLRFYMGLGHRNRPAKGFTSCATSWPSCGRTSCRWSTPST